MQTNLFEIVAYTLPSIITGGVAYYLFNAYFKDQQHTRKWLLQKETTKETAPLKLQAYERMALFLERIHPTKLVLRIKPISNEAKLYEMFLIEHIEQELEHNITQQIYLSNTCWEIIIKSKNAVIALIRNCASNPKIETAEQLREEIIQFCSQKDIPTEVALQFLKQEVSQIF